MRHTHTHTPTPTQRSRKAYLNDKDKVMPRRRNINKRTAWLAEAAPETELGMSTGTGTGDLARPALAFLSARTHHSCYPHAQSTRRENRARTKLLSDGNAKISPPRRLLVLGKVPPRVRCRSMSGLAVAVRALRSLGVVADSSTWKGWCTCGCTAQSASRRFKRWAFRTPMR